MSIPIRGYIVMTDYGLEGWKLMDQSDNYKDIGRIWLNAIRQAGGTDTRVFSVVDSLSVPLSDEPEPKEQQ